MELAVDQIQRTGCYLVRRGRPDHLAAHHAFQPRPRHQPGDAVTPDLEAFAIERQPYLLRTIDAEVLGMDADNLLRRPFVILRTHGAKVGIGLAADVLVPDGGGDSQSPAHRVDPVALHMVLHDPKGRA